MVASAVMALAIAVGGFGTTALLVSQPAGLTVEPSALLWEGETDAAHSTKRKRRKIIRKLRKTTLHPLGRRALLRLPRSRLLPSQSVKEEPAASAAQVAPAEETAAEPTAPETAPSAPMMGGIDELEQENGFPAYSRRPRHWPPKTPLSAPVEQDAVSQPAEPETNSEEQSTPAGEDRGRHHPADAGRDPRGTGCGYAGCEQH